MKKIGILILALLLVNSSYAQIGRMIRDYQSGRDRWYYHSLELGVNMKFSNTSIIQVKPEGQNSLPHTYKVVSPIAFTEHFNFSKNIGYFTPKSGIALIFGSDFNMTYSKAEANSKEVNGASDIEVFQAYISIPMGVAYKFGGEFTQDKSDKFSFTLGLGIAPAISIFEAANTDAIHSYTKLRLPAFVRAEVGVFAGINWKLRLNVYPGNIQHGFNVNNDGYNMTYTGSGSVIQLGLACMPFSFSWKNTNSRW